MIRSLRRRTASRTALRAAALVALALAATLAALPARSSTGAGKLDPELAAALAGGHGRFFVLLRDKADLKGPAAVVGRNARGRAVYDALRRVADSSQAALRQELKSRGVPFASFFIANAVRVEGDLDLATELAAHPEVERIVPERHHPLPEPIPGSPHAQVGSVEWGVHRIGADDVWTQFGVTGQGIVVGTIDTGADYLHPAITANYRGNLGGGVFSHDYNWWDPSQVCGPPGSAPCDNNSHGTHTLGTSIGGDGPGPFSEDIGVAPGAKWITAKGCESSSCSDSALLSSGQFMLAPTDLSGNNPDPSLRPHVVNNSWGGGVGDPFYAAIVDAWRAAGIFPVFSIGNSGPFCGSANSPGDDPDSFAAGATDIFDEIASFSSRGPSAFSGLKPNVAAPGVDVRSSIPGGGYAEFSGTSMAAPHVTGLVALLWSGNPDLLREIDATAAILESTASDRLDFSCGGDGDGDPNNVFGEGIIDALTACQLHCGPTARLTGLVREDGSLAPIGGATVTAVRDGDGIVISTSTQPDGAYTLVLPVDETAGESSYDIAVEAFGYTSATEADLVVAADDEIARDYALTALPRFVVSGTVRDASTAAPLGGVMVRLVGTPLAPVTTDSSGAFAILDVPEGSYTLEAGDRCFSVEAVPVVVSANLVQDFDLSPRSDAFGYQCRVVPFDWQDVDQALPLFGFFQYVSVPLPFPFPFYGTPTQIAHVSTSGVVGLGSPAQVGDYWNVPLPSPSFPNGAAYALWDDFYLDGLSRVEVGLVGSGADRRFVIEYRDVLLYADFTTRVDFQVQLAERGGDIGFHYLNAAGLGDGRSATVGIEDQFGGDALLYSYNEPVLHSGLAIRFLAPPLDSDGDATEDRLDNCPFEPNPDQADGDGDDFGDLCDDCPVAFDPAQADTDSDGAGDACDPCPFSPDCDEDGYEDGLEIELGSQSLNLGSTPEGAPVLGSCLDRRDNDLDGTRDLRASRGEDACNPGGAGLLGHRDQVVVRRFKLNDAVVSAGSRRTERLVLVRATLTNPLGLRAAGAGLPPGRTQSALAQIEARVDHPGLDCTATFISDPLTRAPELDPSRSFELAPAARIELRWLLSVSCEWVAGQQTGRFPDALRLQLRLHSEPECGSACEAFLATPGDLVGAAASTELPIDMVRTIFGDVRIR